LTLLHRTIRLRPLWICFWILAAAAAPCTGEVLSDSSSETFQVLNVYPHDPTAFTQGLLYHDGHFYESTGLHGRSSVRKVVPETGQIVQMVHLPPQYFGEGLARWGERLVQLTWRSRLGFVYELSTLRQVATFRYATEGWGLTEDGTSLIMSDGSSTLRFLHPETYAQTGRLEVRHRGVTVGRLNELEYVKGEILANVWGEDFIVRISPSNGEVLGTVDLSGLRRLLGSGRGPEVLNGIAYDRQRDRLFVTGKLWPKLFEIRVPEIGTQLDRASRRRMKDLSSWMTSSAASRGKRIPPAAMTE